MTSSRKRKIISMQPKDNLFRKPFLQQAKFVFTLRCHAVYSSFSKRKLQNNPVSDLKFQTGFHLSTLIQLQGRSLCCIRKGISQGSNGLLIFMGMSKRQREKVSDFEEKYNIARCSSCDDVLSGDFVNFLTGNIN